MLEGINLSKSQAVIVEIELKTKVGRLEMGATKGFTVDTDCSDCNVFPAIDKYIAKLH